MSVHNRPPKNTTSVFYNLESQKTSCLLSKAESMGPVPSVWKGGCLVPLLLESLALGVDVSCSSTLISRPGSYPVCSSVYSGFCNSSVKTEIDTMSV